MADFHKILAAFNKLTEGITPVGVKHGLNAQQKSVDQMPADAVVSNQSPILGGKVKKNPVSKWMVGSMEEDAGETPDGVSQDTMQILEGHGDSPVARAIANRIIRLHPEMVTDYGIEYLMQAIDDEAERVGDVDEIGSSDVSAWIQNIKRDLDGQLTADLREGVATEDVLSTVKKKLGDYLKNIEDEIKSDPDLKDKLDKDIDVVGPAVKTLTTDDGHEIKIHGNEDDGFRITIQNKPAKSTFKDLDEASMAVEMFNARRRRAAMPVQDDGVDDELDAQIKGRIDRHFAKQKTVEPRAALLQRLKQNNDYVDEK